MAERHPVVNPRSKSGERKEVAFPRQDILSAGKAFEKEALSAGKKFVEAGSFREISDLLGGRRVLGSVIESELDAHALRHRGLPREALSNLVGNLQVMPVEEASEALGISLRTLQRPKNTPAAHLDVQQSGRTWKFAEILAKATRVLGSQEEAEQWLRR